MPSSPPSGYEQCQWFPEDEYTTAPNEFSEASNTWGLSDDQYLDGIFPPGPAHDPQLFADFGTFPGLYPPPFFNEAGSNIAQGENPGDSMTLGATNEPYYSVPVPQVPATQDDQQFFAAGRFSQVPTPQFNHPWVPSGISPYDQPAIIGEAASWAVPSGAPVGYEGMHASHHSQVPGGFMPHVQQAAMGVGEAGLGAIPPGGPVGHQGIGASHVFMSNSHAPGVDHRSVMNIAGNTPTARGGRARRTRPPICSCELCGDTFTSTHRLKSHHNRFHPEPGRQARFACLHCRAYDTSFPHDLKRHQKHCLDPGT